MKTLSSLAWDIVDGLVTGIVRFIALITGALLALGTVGTILHLLPSAPHTSPDFFWARIIIAMIGGIFVLVIFNSILEIMARRSKYVKTESTVKTEGGSAE